jgi:hypothetical protein
VKEVVLFFLKGGSLMLYLFISLMALALLVIIGVPYLIDMFEAMNAFRKAEGVSIPRQLISMMGFAPHAHT